MYYCDSASFLRFLPPSLSVSLSLPRPLTLALSLFLSLSFSLSLVLSRSLARSFSLASDELSQLLARGIRSFRVQPRYLSQPECKTHGIIAHSGCLILSYDAPVNTRRFNTTSDLVAHVLSMASHWPLGAPAAFFHLDFRNVPTDACDPHSDWARVVSQFVNLAQRALKQVNVRFVVASAAAKQSCLNKLWVPWVDSYVPGIDPAAAFLSNNVSLGFNLYAVLDAADVKSVAQLNFGKFRLSQSLMFAETSSNQQAVLDAASAYVNVSIASIAPLPAILFFSDSDVQVIFNLLLVACLSRLSQG